jgi:ureidoglycolate lyase
MIQALNVVPLTQDAFAPYGQVLNLGGVEAAARRINAGTSQRFDLPGPLQLSREGGNPALAVFRAQAQAPDGPWHLLERHRLGSQTFVPLGGARALLIVALGASSPDRSTLAAFAVEGQQGFTLSPGTWHHPLIARDAGDFLVIERTAAEADGGVDCEVVQLAPPLWLNTADLSDPRP